MVLSRRRLLSGVTLGLCSLAGCRVLNHVSDIWIYNETVTELTATLNVTAGGTQALEETFTLSPGGPDDNEAEKVYREVVGAETARIRLTVQNGPEKTYEFTDTEADARGVHAEVYSDQIKFKQVVV